MSFPGSPMSNVVNRTVTFRVLRYVLKVDKIRGESDSIRLKFEFAAR